MFFQLILFNKLFIKNIIAIIGHLIHNFKIMEYIQIFLQIVLIFIGLYLAKYKSYFQEKGKNIATKEDIEEITEKVEKIKNDLNYVTQTKISLKSDEKKALIEYYEKYYNYKNYLFNTNLIGIHENNQEKIAEIEEKINQYSFEYELSSAKMELLVNSPELTDKTRDLDLEIIKLKGIIADFIGKMEKLFLDVKLALNNLPLDEQKDKIKEIYEDRAELSKETYSKKIEAYKELYPIEFEVREQIYKMLQNLVII